LKGGEKVKKVVSAFLLLVLMLLASASTVITVQASKPTEVNGTYSPLPPPSQNIVNSDGKSDNTKQDTVIRVIWQGSISGTGILEMSSTNLNVGTLDERGVIHGELTLNTGISIFGVVKTGTLTIKLHNVIERGDKSGGVWRIVGGSGDLEGLHGEGTLELAVFQPPVIVIAYAGQVHYEP
jgi:hypothetical protein